PRPRRVELKGLRRSGEPDGGCDFECLGVEGGKRLLGVTNVYLPGAAGVAHIVGARQLEAIEEGVAPRVEGVADAIISVAHEDTVQVEIVGDALDLLLPGYLSEESARLQIDNIQAVVGEVGHEQPGVLGVQSKMVQAAGRAAQSNGLHQL